MVSAELPFARKLPGTWNPDSQPVRFILRRRHKRTRRLGFPRLRRPVTISHPAFPGSAAVLTAGLGAAGTAALPGRNTTDGAAMRWLLIGYMFLFIDRPFEVWPWLGDLHIERIYMLFTIAAWTVYPYKRWLPNAQHSAYAAFALAVGLCWAMSPWADHGQPVVEDWFKIVVFYFLLVTTVHDEEGLKQIAVGFLAVMGLYLVHSFREYLGGRHTFRMGISRMMGVDDTLGDPNSFGASIVFALPIVVAVWKTGLGGRLGRWLLTGLRRAVVPVRAADRFAVIAVGPGAVVRVHHLEDALPLHRAGRVRRGCPAGVLRPARVAANPLRDNHQPGCRPGQRQGIRRGAVARADDGIATVGSQPAQRRRPRGLAAGDRQQDRKPQSLRPASGRTGQPRGSGVLVAARLFLGEPASHQARCATSSRSGATTSSSRCRRPSASASSCCCSWATSDTTSSASPGCGTAASSSSPAIASNGAAELGTGAGTGTGSRSGTRIRPAPGLGAAPAALMPVSPRLAGGGQPEPPASRGLTGLSLASNPRFSHNEPGVVAPLEATHVRRPPSCTVVCSASSPWRFRWPGVRSLPTNLLGHMTSGAAT